jgi:NAD(P)-dependent dehydrogenase (short-subunit alcohol dehydrogenase family)
MSTILITGCSTGFGLETARYFADRGWNVVATMRTPRDGVLPQSDNIRILPLDVTDADSIAQAIAAAGPIDAIVNNAGIGFLNSAEDTPLDVAREIFETNVIGLVAVTQAVLPQFRARRSGTIVNVSSSATYKALPLLSVYSASKAAANAFSDSLAREVEQFGVRVRVVLPGRAPDTSFGDNARARMTEGFTEPYVGLAQAVFTAWEQDTGPVTSSTDVAEAIWRAIHDEDSPAHIPAGADAIAWSQGR